MYTHCLSCHHALGANEELESFPVGRRLAFDAAKGRLWVVCPHCARWNLTPLEARWEAVEECERRFRATPLRASTDHVGLTRLPSGLELVRVGPALGPELALWRYGRRFRWRRHLATVRQGVRGAGNATRSIATLAVVASGSLATVFGSPLMAALVVTGVSGVVVSGVVVDAVRDAYGTLTVARLRATDDGQLLRVRARDVMQAALAPTGDGGWALRVAHREGTAELTGPAALRAAGALLTRVNLAGAEDHEVRLAARRLASLRDPLDAFAIAAGERRLPSRSAVADRMRRLTEWHAEPHEEEEEAAARSAPGDALIRLPREVRLALEMAAHEDAERRAMEGELAALEAAWREAEEIAAIADDLLLPAAVDDWLRRRRAEGRA